MIRIIFIVGREGKWYGGGEKTFPTDVIRWKTAGGWKIDENQLHC